MCLYPELLCTDDTLTTKVLSGYGFLSIPTLDVSSRDNQKVVLEVFELDLIMCAIYGEGQGDAEEVKYQAK